MTRSVRTALVLAVAIAIAIAPTPSGPSISSAHDFEETRRLVLSVEADHLELLVAYEVRPGRIADALTARFDADHDGRVTSALERLARAQTMSPRLRHALAVFVDDREVSLSLERLAFPPPPAEGGRRGVAAVALYSARLPRRPRPGHSVSVTVRTRGARGYVSVEAQAAPLYQMTGDGIESRSGDPVIGPGSLPRVGALTFTVSAAPPATR